MIRIAIAVIAWALIIIGPLIAFFGIAGPMPGFYSTLLGVLIGLVAFLVGVIAFFMKKRDRGTWFALSGILPAILLVAIAGGGLSVPPINDISTDLDNPPEFVAALDLEPNKDRDMDYPEEFKEQVRDFYTDLKPLTIDASPAEAYEKALNAAKAHSDWTITREDAANYTFEGYATTAIYKWKDDFIVRVQPEGDGARIDMRSKSRDGRSDLGANAARIQSFFSEIQ